jgi:hypothetical protein
MGAGRAWRALHVKSGVERFSVPLARRPNRDRLSRSQSLASIRVSQIKDFAPNIDDSEIR